MYICNCTKVYGKNFKVSYEHTDSCKAHWKRYKKENGSNPRARLS